MKRILYYGEQLRPQLQTLIETCIRASDSSMPWENDFFGRLLPFVGGGKLLRGGLLCYAYEAYSGQPATEQAAKAALALELLHSALLIHDDIMDNDPLRRGQPALHWQYRQLGLDQDLDSPAQFGRNMAICGGDALFLLAFGLLVDTADSSDTHRRACRLFTDHLIQVCFGQMQDVYFDSQPAVPAKSAIYKLMEAKTASYTLSLPLAMGAALAGQRNSELDHLEDIGKAAGVAYQIRDDELGLWGDEAVVGKPVGSDIREGKKTLAYYFLLKQCPAVDRRRLQQLFGSPDLTPADIAYVQQLLSRFGITELLEREIEKLLDQARSITGKLNLSEVARTELHSLIAFCGQRQY